MKKIKRVCESSASGIADRRDVRVLANHLCGLQYCTVYTRIKSCIADGVVQDIMAQIPVYRGLMDFGHFRLKSVKIRKIRK